MKKQKTVSIDFEVFDNENALNTQDAQLLAKAKEASVNAYAPYSNFLVGAAILTKSGKIIIGNNQENIAYPSGLCAERTAIFHLGATYPNEIIDTIAVAARKREGDFATCSPCGGCRQVMLEYEDKQKEPIRFIMQGEGKSINVLSSVSSLMPFKFDAIKID